MKIRYLALGLLAAGCVPFATLDTLFAHTGPTSKLVANQSAGLVSNNAAHLRTLTGVARFPSSVLSLVSHYRTQSATLVPVQGALAQVVALTATASPIATASTGADGSFSLAVPDTLSTSSLAVVVSTPTASGDVKEWSLPDRDVTPGSTALVDRALEGGATVSASDFDGMIGQLDSQLTDSQDVTVLTDPASASDILSQVIQSDPLLAGYASDLFPAGLSSTSVTAGLPGYATGSVNLPGQ